AAACDEKCCGNGNCRHDYHSVREVPVTEDVVAGCRFQVVDILGLDLLNCSFDCIQPVGVMVELDCGLVAFQLEAVNQRRLVADGDGLILNQLGLFPILFLIDE
ncbi:Hypothetical predicted protein, partial [Paramuricea clavata]